MIILKTSCGLFIRRSNESISWTLFPLAWTSPSSNFRVLFISVYGRICPLFFCSSALGTYIYYLDILQPESTVAHNWVLTIYIQNCKLISPGSGWPAFAMPVLKGIKLLKLGSVANHCPKRWYCWSRRIYKTRSTYPPKTLRDQPFVVQSKTYVNIILAVYYCGITFQVV